MERLLRLRWKVFVTRFDEEQTGLVGGFIRFRYPKKTRSNY